jgi:alpha-1,6-mannosyltransferase
MRSDTKLALTVAPDLPGAADALDESSRGHPEPTGWPHGVPMLLGAVGALGMSLIALSSVVLGPHGPTGSAIERDVVALVPSNAAVPIGAASMTLGLVLVLGAWLVLGLILRRGASVRPLIRIAATWSAPIVLGPPLFSRDVYSYAAEGLMVTRHVNPYTNGPGALHSAKYVTPISTIWLRTRCPYGPLFLRLAQLAVGVTGRSLLGAILVLRVYEILGVVLIAAALPTLARSVGKDPARAVWLGVCNPLVLFHFIGGAHNDSLMVGLLVAGLAVATTKRYATGVVLCSMAATVKNPAVLGIAFIALEAIRNAPPDRRLNVFARLSGVAAATFALISLITGIGFGWVGALGVPGKNMSYLTPTTFAAHFVSDVVGHDAAVLTTVRVLGVLFAAAGVAVLMWRAPRLGTARACGLALATVVACGPIILPWYALWGLIVLAAVGRRIERGFAIFASVVLAIMLEPSGSVMPDVVLMSAVVLLTLVAVAIVWRPARAWIRRDLAPAIDRYRNAGTLRGLTNLIRVARPRRALAR